MKVISLQSVTGGAAAVLSDFLEDPTVVTAKALNINVAMTVCRGIAEKRAKDTLREMILPSIEEAYEIYVLTHGPYENCEDRAARDEWAEGIDNAIEQVFLPYEKCVTASWFGQAVIDTRLHEPVKEGDTPEAERLARGFADDVWRVLIHDTDYQGDGPPVLTTNKILSAVGIVQSDVAELLSNKPDPTPQQVQEAEAKQMQTLNDVLNKIYYACGGQFDRNAFKGLFELAFDDDDGLALSGVSQLCPGATIDDAEPLRAFALAYSGDTTPEDALCDALLDAPYDDDATDSVPAREVGKEPALAAPYEAVQTDADEDAAMAEMMGGAPTPAPAPVAQTGAPPPPVTRTRKGKASEPGITGALPPTVFDLLRKHVKLKDEEIAAAIGVSRQTFINYGKPTAKPTFVPSAEQKKTLTDMCDNALKGLAEAKAQIEGA